MLGGKSVLLLFGYAPFEAPDAAASMPDIQEPPQPSAVRPRRAHDHPDADSAPRLMAAADFIECVHIQ
jgi:hypothetical protein